MAEVSRTGSNRLRAWLAAQASGGFARTTLARRTSAGLVESVGFYGAGPNPRTAPLQ